MAILVSPGTAVSEQDLTNAVVATSGVTGAFAGAFQWGPVLERTLVTSEQDIINNFGKPKVGFNRVDWFSVAYFLKYSNQCYVVRVTDTAARNAVTDVEDSGITALSASTTVINNYKDFEFNYTNPDSAIVAARYPGAWGTGLQLSVIDSAGFSTSPFAALFDAAPTGTEVHVVVSKSGEVLEKFSYLNLTSGTFKIDGTKAYIVDVLNESSLFVYVDASVAAGTYTLAFGEDGAHPGAGVVTGYDLFASKDEVDVSLIFAGGTDSAYVINQKVLDTATGRGDANGFISPLFDSVKAGGSTSADAVIVDRNGITGDSYGFMDSNWGYIYDAYNKSNVWIPFNSSTAGLTAMTETIAQPWDAPAGFNRGKYRGFIKCAWEQNQAIRDKLYKAQVNPITNFKGEGIVLYGQKTLQAKPSAFDRLNVRRLFILLEKAIENAAKYQLFEKNNAQTQLIFRNMVNAFLRDIKGKGGIEDFLVVCDDTNNTAQVKQTNQFVGDIYIKPVYVAEFIQLNFINTPLGVDFNTIIGG